MPTDVIAYDRARFDAVVIFLLVIGPEILTVIKLNLFELGDDAS